jgi:aryl-alcohol dehydrogenase-like predicted oxidoreductase
MERRRFGDSELEVSAVALGCWIFGVDWWGHYTQQDANRMCSYAFERGVTFFDNGDAYGNGRAEMLFGQWLKDAKIDRSKVEIGGKFGYDFYSDPGTLGSHRERRQDFSPQFMRTALERSLQRLGTDYVDLYMAHNIKLPQYRDDMFAELGKLKDEGKIKTWGVSLGPAIGWYEEGIRAMTEYGAKAVQTVFNLFEQDPGRAFCQTAVATKAGVMARVHDNSSILKDVVKVDTVIGKDDHRKFRDQAWKVYGIKKVEIIRPLAQKYGMSIHELACKWLLQQPGLTSITGTFLNEKEIQEAIDATTKPNLSAAELQDLAMKYAEDWGLGAEAHPCDLKSSTSESGMVRSSYVAPPVLMA